MPADPERTIGSREHRAEAARQIVHIVSGLWAGLLRWVTPAPLIVLAGAATVFNLWLLPRLGGLGLWRRHEAEAGGSAGVALYPLTVLALLALFFRRPEVAAAGWGLLAFSDGAATLTGRAVGRSKLPWNPVKSWAGLLAYVVVGFCAVLVLISWVVPHRYELPFLLVVAALVAVFAGLLESAPQRLDDNLRVPLIAALFLLCLLETETTWQVLLEPPFSGRWRLGLVVNLVLVIVARVLRSLSGSGAVIAFLIGALTVVGLGWPGYCVLLAFFVIGSAATRIGYAAKVGLGLAQAGGGRRRAANALANGAVATACAVFAATTPWTSLFVSAFASSLAAAAADTAESEIGQVWGRPTVLITEFRRVPAGTNGGVSGVGSLAGLGAATLTIATGWGLGLYPAAAVLPLSLLAFAATLVESVVGATVEHVGLLNNDGVNFFNTLLAALLGAGWAWFVG